MKQNKYDRPQTSKRHRYRRYKTRQRILIIANCKVDWKINMTKNWHEKKIEMQN
jgi:hypothetical protein